MRIIIHGIGAIGGVVAAALAEAGTPVIGIARGARLAAIRAHGMTLRAPDGVRTVRFDCVASPAEIAFRPDDMIILAVKGQDTAEALQDLRAAGVTDQPLFCAQNGVANETAALRIFDNVHGINVMLPATYVTDGETVTHGTPNYGIFDIGRFPDGVDDADRVLAECLSRAHIAGYAVDDVMAKKYGKLIQNLGNIVEAAVGPGDGNDAFVAHLRAEGRSVLDGAGIVWTDVGAADPRRGTVFRLVDVPGAPRAGSSSTQSLTRATGRIETDYLNGEIALIARLHGLAAPANAYAARLGADLARTRAAPGSVPRAEFARGLGL